jgi:hypothetical protein
LDKNILYDRKIFQLDTNNLIFHSKALQNRYTQIETLVLKYTDPNPAKFPQYVRSAAEFYIHGYLLYC